MSNLVEVKVPDIGDFAEVPVIDLFVKVGDSIKVDDAICTLESDKATMDVPSPVAGVVKEVLVQLGAKVAEGALLIKVEGGASAATTEATAGPRVNPEKAPKTDNRSVACGTRAGGRQPCRRCRPRVRDARPRRRPRWLLGRLPLGRPRHEDDHRRALRHSRRRLPQRWLHSVQGAAACCRGHGRGRTRQRPRRHLCRTDGRHRQAACPQGQGRRQADRRSGRHGQGAQGQHRARLRFLPRCQSHRGRRNHRQQPGKDRRKENHQVPEVHHRRRFGRRASALHSARPAHRRFDRGARTALRAEEDAGHRRRHHRSRNGHRLFHPRRPRRCRGNDGCPDAGSRPRHRQGLGKAERQPLRQDHAEDQDGCGQRQGRRTLRDLRRRRRTDRSRSSTT